MPRGISLHIGLNSVDPAHYDGWDGALNACEFDAQDMQKIAKDCGYEPRMLLTAEATAGEILAAIEKVAGELESGDAFLLTYSGHGGQVPDRNGEGEKDRSDETWVAYDRQIVDDELYAVFGTFDAGVRIFMLSDSCHSGTVNRDITGEVPDPVSTRAKADAQSPRYRALPRDVMIKTYKAHEDDYDKIQTQVPSARTAGPAARVLLISGCQDEQLSLDGISNGLFTETLKEVWADSAWEGSYAKFHEAIRAKMPSTQQPYFNPVGGDDEAFDQQKPFTIG